MRVVVERAGASAAARQLWKGLVRFNREQAGPMRHSRLVLTVRGERARVLRGLILQSYWKESYIELLSLSAKARRQGAGRRLIETAERRARRRGSRLMHLNTYSFQAPGFYEKLGYRRFGSLRGSPAGASRHFYVKSLAKGSRAYTITLSARRTTDWRTFDGAARSVNWKPSEQEDPSWRQ